MNALARSPSRHLAWPRVVFLGLGFAAMRLACAASIDLAIAIDDGKVMLERGDTSEYQVIVTNRGPDPVHQATVHVSVSGYAGQTLWTCETGTGAPCAVAQGVGPPVQLIDVPVDGLVIYHLSVTVGTGPADTLTVRGTIRGHGDESDTDDADNVDSDIDTIGMFANSFETP